MSRRNSVFRKHLRKHLDRYPAAPTAPQLATYEGKLRAEHERLKLRYYSGPRHGQQLADVRSRASKRAVSPESRPLPLP